MFYHRLGIDRPKGFEVCRAKRLFEGRSVLFGGWQPVVPLLQFRSGLDSEAFGDDLLKQTTRLRAHHQKGHANAARGLTHDRHVARIAAERSDVLLHPSERFDLIQKAVIAGDSVRRFRAQLRQREPAERTEPVIDGYKNHAVLCEVRALILRLPASASDE